MVEETQKSDVDRYSELNSTDPAYYHWRLLIRSPWKPPTDVFETEDSLVVRVEVAGMHENDFSIELNGRELTIRGVRQDTSERRSYHQMEIRFGEFVITIELPFFINSDLVQALYNNGFLIVSLPKARPRHITISE